MLSLLRTHYWGFQIFTAGLNEVLPLPNLRRRSEGEERSWSAVLFSAATLDGSWFNWMHRTLIISGVDSWFQGCYPENQPHCRGALITPLRVCSWVLLGLDLQLQSAFPGMGRCVHVPDFASLLRWDLLACPHLRLLSPFPSWTPSITIFSICFIPSPFCVFRPWTQNTFTFSSKPWDSSEHSAESS